MLYGIFLYHVITCEHRKVKELQLLFIDDVEQPKNFPALVWHRVRYNGERLVRALIDPCFPLGSRRRETLKKMLRRMGRPTA